MNDKKPTSTDLAKVAREALLDKKAVNVLVLDVRGISDVTDYFVIATGNSHPHLKALMSECERVLQATRSRAFRVSGKPESGWLVADYWDVVVHIFTPDARGFYGLEALWKDAKIVE